MSPLEKVRLAIHDTDVGSPLFTDAEIESFLEDEGDVLGASAAAAESLAARYALQVDVASDDQSLKLGQRAAAFTKLGETLRARAEAEAPLGTIPTEKVDGYNDTGVDNESSDGTSGARGRVRQGYLDPDQVP